MARRAQTVPAADLADEQLMRELQRTWKERPEALFDGDGPELEAKAERMRELEGEFATRHAEELQPDPWRTRKGARARAGQPVDGGGVPRKATVRRLAETQDGGGSLPPGDVPGFERRQGTKRRRRAERMEEGKPFQRHSIGTTGEKPLPSPSRPRTGRSKEPVENPDVNRRTRGSSGGRPAGKKVATRGRKGGTSTRGASTKTGAANRRVGRPNPKAASSGSPRGRRRPKSGGRG